ncbi:MAG: hypothetical protein KatS3mg105_0935 [Gemmatales bacterium]|nr:MAG: hypothetical protein KatS3mg105_0935 [Gemmatales bacterium]
MEEILGETYGVMVFQEQVMQILNRLGGIELSSAYACIKAISKKKQEIIDQRRVEFIAGCPKARSRRDDSTRNLRPDRSFRRLWLQQIA